MHRSLKLITAAVNPLFTTAQAKQHLRVDTTADDTIIDNLILAATQSCEIYTNRYFITTVVEQYADNFNGLQHLYKSPVASVTHIKYYDNSDSLQTWDAANYIVDNVTQPARIALAVNKSYPAVSDRINAVVAKYEVGYGDNSSDVPEGIRQAVLLCIANWYENRQTVVTGTIATELPLSSQYLLNQYKIQVC